MKYISFDRVYWYLQDCPLKRRSDPVIDEVAFDAIYRKAVTPGIRELYRGDEAHEVLQRTADRVSELDIPTSARGAVAETTTLMLAYSTMMIAQVPEGTILAENLVLDYEDMIGDVDIVRLKEISKLIQLVWVNYMPEYPDAETRLRLYQLAQWNGRLYELVHGKRPFHLTYFLPLVGDFITFTYNPDSRMEVIAEMIRIDAVPARPGPQCDTCSMCSMQYNVLMEKGDMHAHRLTW